MRLLVQLLRPVAQKLEILPIVTMVRHTHSQVTQPTVPMVAHLLVPEIQLTTLMAAHQPALGIQHTILTEHLTLDQEMLRMARMVQTVHVMVIQLIVIKVGKY